MDNKVILILLYQNFIKKKLEGSSEFDAQIKSKL